MFNKIKDKTWLWVWNKAPYVISILLITLWWLFIYVPREIIGLVEYKYYKKKKEQMLKEMEDDS